MTEFYLEPLDTRETISGPDVASDLCSRLYDVLTSRSELRTVDAFISYSASVAVRLQLFDVDQVEVQQDVVIRTLDPDKVTKKVDVTVPYADALEVRVRSELPEPNFEKEAADAPVKRRWYTPRTPRGKETSK